MTTKNFTSRLKPMLSLVIAGIILSSCASSYYFQETTVAMDQALSDRRMVADDDVYIKRPSQIELLGDADDPTSFNTYKAGKSGQIDSRFNNPHQTTIYNYGMTGGFMHGGFHPYYNPYYDPFHNPWGSPHHFGYAGMGWNNGFNPYWGNHGWGNNGWGNPYGWGYHQGWGHHNGWGHHGGWGQPGWGNTGGWGQPLIGGNNNSLTGNSPVSMGPRQGLSTNSGRSSAYPTTMKSSQGTSGNTQGRRSDGHNNISSSNGKSVSNSGVSANSNNDVNRRTVDTREFVRPQSVDRNIQSAGDRRNVATSSRNDNSFSNPSNTSGVSSRQQPMDYRPSQQARNSGVTTSSFDRRNSGFDGSRTAPSGTHTRSGHTSSPSRHESGWSSSPSRSGGFDGGSGGSRGGMGGSSGGGSSSGGSSGGGAGGRR
jgi:hypothetical protein